MLQGNSGIGAVTRQLINDYQKQLQLNVDIGNQLRKENDSTYRHTLLILIAGSASAILLLGFTLKTILLFVVSSTRCATQWKPRAKIWI